MFRLVKVRFTERQDFLTIFLTHGHVHIVFFAASFRRGSSLVKINAIAYIAICNHRGVEVLCYWSQKCDAKIFSGAHAAHWRHSFP